MMNKLIFVGLLALTTALPTQARWGNNQATKKSTGWFDAPPIDESATNALYDQIPAVISDYQAGIELSRSGRVKPGENQSEQALVHLNQLARNCTQLRGCEPSSFFTAYQTLLKLQVVVQSESAPDDEPKSASPATDADEPIDLVTAPLQTPVRPIELRKSRDFSAQIQLSEPIRAAINDWLTWGRPNLAETFQNYQNLRHLMWPNYAKAGLPESLLFGILAKESFARVHSYSRAGAAGPLQFMPDTGKRYGLAGDGSFDLRLDPNAASAANAAYLEDQLNIFSGDVELALAAYNGGEGRMKRLAERFPGKHFWSNEIYYALPQETRDYVPRVLAAAYLFDHAQQFNLDFSAAPPTPAKLSLQRPVSLSELAICLGAKSNEGGWFRTLRNLNPRVATDKRLDAGFILDVPEQLLGTYQTHCLESESMALFASLHDARFPAGPTTVPYTVRRGDTLVSIARRSNCMEATQIADLNNLLAPRFTLRIGQQIKLKACGSS
jgi:membrane-bound lytic murein transglycosylase D